MSQRDKIHLRRSKRAWQSRQETAGVITLFLGLITLGALFRFVCAPGYQVAAVVLGLVIVLGLSCVGLIGSAAKVVSIRQQLKPSPINAEFLEAERTDAIRRRRALPFAHTWDYRN